MLNRYSEGSEHEYLAWLVSDRYYQEVNKLESISAEARECLVAGRMEDHECLVSQRNDLQRQLLEQRWRGEEIVYRLWLDSSLRAEGLSLPEVWEKVDALFEPLEKRLERF